VFGGNRFVDVEVDRLGDHFCRLNFHIGTLRRVRGDKRGLGFKSEHYIIKNVFYVSLI